MNNSDTNPELNSHRIRPIPQLMDIVERVWIQHHDFIPVNRPASGVVPTGTVEILFHYGDPVSHIGPGEPTLMPRTYVTGQRSRPVWVMRTGRLQAIIISLYPWGLQALFPGVSELTDGFVDLKLLGHANLLSALEENLVTASGPGERIRLVQDFLLTIRNRSINPAMTAAAKLLSCPEGNQPIRFVTRALGMSERHLSRQFKSTIGIQPSLFMRIMRFQNAIRARRETGMHWASIAADCGFSDQPHLIREIRTFAGRTPGNIVLDSGTSQSTFNGRNASDFFDTVYL